MNAPIPIIGNSGAWFLPAPIGLHRPVLIQSVVASGGSDILELEQGGELELEQGGNLDLEGA